MKKDYIVRQNDLKDCGVCCLESLFKFYDGYIPIETLRLDTNTTIEGTNAYNLINAAKKYGLNGYGRKVETLNEEILLPAIAHLNLNNGIQHFVVIYRTTKKHIYIMDPAKGYVKYTKEQFQEIWTNIVLEFTPYKNIPSIKKNKSTINMLINTLIKEKYLFTKLIIQSLILIFLSIITSYYFKIITNSLENNYITTTIFIMIIYLSLYLLKIYLSYLKNEYIIYLEKNIDLDIILDLVHHIFKLPLNVIKSRSSGEIISRVNEFKNIKTIFIEIITTLFPDFLLTIVTSYFLFTTSNELFFILCIISLLYILIGIITTPLIYSKINNNIDSETEFNSNLIEKIDGIESIKNINKTNYFFNCLTKHYIIFKQNDLLYKRYLNKILLIKNYIYEIGIFIINSIGIILITKNKLTFINLITFNTLLSYFLNPIITVINMLPELYFIKLSIIKTTEFYQAKEEETSVQKFVNGSIILNNLSYTYNNTNKILNKINITIKEKEHIHLTGPSGTGKSTICKILTKELENYEGEITINNINLKTYKNNTIRSNLIYVSQREKLFSDTILKNILVNTKISEEELNKIIKITGLNKIIQNKTQQLETYLYDGGYNLSGGERQRIVLARALAQNPKILILDESLSELDIKSEVSILKKLDKNYKDTTIIYISHSKTKYFKKTINIGT